ncbi:MAG: family 78 glycoside hydrolase catalytic domain [Planctomycetes bacterium]|nr:family 78 glycoside hydrolase catalytic domain [Planctomycetota bacterium]
MEYLVQPLGLDERKPRFSFELDDERRGAKQTAWQILVASSEAELDSDAGGLWDSGKRETADTCQIEYPGKDLLAWTHYWWKVRSWDGDGQVSPWSENAHWSTGALLPTDWQAHWIEEPTPAQEFVPGNRGWCSQFTDKEDDYKWVKFDLGEGAIFDTVRLYPARSEDGTNKPWSLFPIRINVWGSDYPGFDDMKRVFKVIDQSEFDIKLPEDPDGPLELHTLSRMKMQYVMISLTKLAHDEKRGYGAAFAEVEVVDSQSGQVISSGKQVWASDSREEDNWSARSLSDGITTSSSGAGDMPLREPRLRHEFQVSRQVTHATLACTALGLYEVRVNGKPVTQDVLAPGWSDYRKRAVYDTYDITNLLAQGPNAIAVQLADGWYAGRVGLAQIFVGGPQRGLYGRKPAFYGQLTLEFADGQRQTIPTSADWKSKLEGPLVNADLLDGEVYDARAEESGWDRAGFDDHDWKPAAMLLRVSTTPNSQRGTPVRVVGELPPVSVKELGPNRWLFDFGRNIGGWCRLRARAPAGAELVLRHAELLKEDGSLYTENLRSAKQTDHYVFKGGGEESFEPRFTFHGFRYVEASFPGAKPGEKLEQPQLVAQLVSNSAEQSGSFHAQQPVLTKLWENIGTTLRANIQSLPTDCPQRDERMGWMGDIQAFGPTAMYHSNLAAFFTQWLQPVRDSLSSGHRFSDFSPNPFSTETDFVGAPGWADAGIFLPFELWKNYGDTRVLGTTLPFATRWMEFIDSKNPDGLWSAERGNDYGDWLNGSQIQAAGWDTNGCEVDKELFATAFWARSAELTGMMAAVDGKTDLADRYLKMSDRVRAAFQKAYIQPDGTIKGDTQAAYALALAFNLVPKNLVPLVQAKLSVSITEKRAGHMSTGMQTTHRMLIELARRGYEELASRLVRSKDFPSWGWQQDQGATSIWERWDGLYPGRGPQDPSMNSFNHFAFGSVGEWLMGCVAGIRPDTEGPGYARFFIEPRAGLQIPAAGGSYHSIRGTIVSDWKIQGDNFVLDVTVPPNTSATVVLPSLGIESVREGGKSVLEAAPYVLPLDYEKGLVGAEFAGRASFDVHAGKYHFESQFRLPSGK